MPFEIAPVDPSKPIPESARCQEASFLSINYYIPCNAPAVAIVEHRGQGAHYMCDACADHNLHNRRGILRRVKNDFKGVAYGIDPATYVVD
jgi:hypothetical protein